MTTKPRALRNQKTPGIFIGPTRCDEYRKARQVKVTELWSGLELQKLDTERTTLFMPSIDLLRESISCFQNGAYLATAVMCGAAIETAVYIAVIRKVVKKPGNGLKEGVFRISFDYIQSDWGRIIQSAKDKKIVDTKIEDRINFVRNKRNFSSRLAQKTDFALSTICKITSAVELWITENSAFGSLEAAASILKTIIAQDPVPEQELQRSTEEARELAVFMVELREQSAQIATAFMAFVSAGKDPPPIDDKGKRQWNQRIWLLVHALLSAASNISHILWPNPDKGRGPEAVSRSVRRGRELRLILGIKGENPMISRRVRNAFEHIDERLDDWLPTVPELIPFGWAVSTYNSEDEPEEAKNALRYLNIQSMNLRVAGENCNVEELVSWIASIERRIPLEAQMVLRKHEEE